MNIVYFGTPDFAIPPLRAILDKGFAVSAVATAPDKIRGRGKATSPTPVKEFALKNNLRVIEIEDLKDSKFETELRNMKPDLFVVVAFRILPKNIFTIPRFGSFNLHGSLLPKYRGAAPIQWALINGDKETGLTTFFLKETVDSGNIILQEKIAIDEEDDFKSLYDKMSLLGADLTVKTIEAIKKNNCQLKNQNDSLATKAPKITKETCKINWNMSAESIKNLIRGLSPIPGAFFVCRGKQIKIYKAKVVETDKFKPGETSASKNELIIGCGTNALSILEIQQEGKRKMNIEEFLRGFTFDEFINS